MHRKSRWLRATRVSLRALLCACLCFGASRAFSQDLAGLVPQANVYSTDSGVGTGETAMVTGSGSLTVSGPVLGTNINQLVGADTFYLNGYTGSYVTIANIEGGHGWSGHETLSTALEMTNDSLALNEFDRHATYTAMALAGREAGVNAGSYQQGMAPDAQLFTGAFSAQWGSTARYATSFSFYYSSVLNQYEHAFSSGMDGNGRTADVISSSWGGGDPTGTGVTALIIDALAYSNTRTLSVAAAGNTGVGPNQVGAPGSGYNGLTVAALGPAPTYNTPSTFSSGGPNDYADPVNGTVSQARQPVDIAAPGEGFTLAYYGGTTGGNGTTDNVNVPGTGPTGLAQGAAGSPSSYFTGLAGTSFATPTVAGGAALLYDAAYAAMPLIPDARDARVVKAVLMNSADKTVGWDNGQVLQPNGGVITTQGLDSRVGTGAMNLTTAYHQFLDGTTDVPGTASGNLGTVMPVGWDYGDVNSAAMNDYYFASQLLGGSTFTATLTWFRDRYLDSNGFLYDLSFDNLDLELWSVVGGVPQSLISASMSTYNNSEHFSFALPSTGYYVLRVHWVGQVFDQVNDPDSDFYGLAWSAVAVPEPATLILAMLGLCGCGGVALRMRRQVNRTAA